MSLFALGLALLIGAIWDPLTGFAMIGNGRRTGGDRRLHAGLALVHYALRDPAPRPLQPAAAPSCCPIVGMVLFFFPLYYQFYEAPPTYPIKGANWVALAWAVVGVVLTVWLARRRPEKLRDMERVYVDDT